MTCGEGTKIDANREPRSVRWIRAWTRSGVAAVLGAEPFAKGVRDMRAVITGFTRVDAPVVPFFAHQPGEEAAEEPGPVIRLLEVTDDLLERCCHVRPPLR